MTPAEMERVIWLDPDNLDDSFLSDESLISSNDAGENNLKSESDGHYKKHNGSKKESEDVCLESGKDIQCELQYSEVFNNLRVSKGKSNINYNKPKQLQLREKGGDRIVKNVNSLGTEPSDYLNNSAEVRRGKLSRDNVACVENVPDGNKSRSYTCMYCGRKFSQKGGLLAHERIHSGEKPYQCERCGKAFTQLSGLNYHRKTHLEEGNKHFVCEICNSGYSTKIALNNHKNKHSGDRPYKCEHCDRTFRDPNSLRRHAKFHTGADVVCSYSGCKKAFYSKSQMQTHLHIHTGKKPVCCEVCKKTMTSNAKLQEHMLLHKGVRPFSCPVCSKQFTQKVNMFVHVGKIHGIDKDLVEVVKHEDGQYSSKLLTHGQSRARPDLRGCRLNKNVKRSNVTSKDCQSESLIGTNFFKTEAKPALEEEEGDRGLKSIVKDFKNTGQVKINRSEDRNLQAVLKFIMSSDLVSNGYTSITLAPHSNDSRHNNVLIENVNDVHKGCDQSNNNPSVSEKITDQDKIKSGSAFFNDEQLTFKLQNDGKKYKRNSEGKFISGNVHKNFKIMGGKKDNLFRELQTNQHSKIQVKNLSQDDGKVFVFRQIVNDTEFEDSSQEQIVYMDEEVAHSVEVDCL